MLGKSCLEELHGPCMRVVNFEYTVSDLNYINITSIKCVLCMHGAYF